MAERASKVGQSLVSAAAAATLLLGTAGAAHAGPLSFLVEEKGSCEGEQLCFNACEEVCSFSTPGGLEGLRCKAVCHKECKSIDWDKVDVAKLRADANTTYEFDNRDMPDAEIFVEGYDRVLLMGDEDDFDFDRNSQAFSSDEPFKP